MRATTSLLAASALVSGVVAHAHDSHHAHSQARALPSTWHHASDHPVHALFQRDDATSSPEPGSAAWVATYPTDKPDPSTMPQAWKDALAAAISSGKIPNFAPSVSDPTTGLPSYPPGSDLKSVTGFCVSNQGCRVPGDIWDAPDGVWGLGFDDGPLPSSDKLYQFLQQNNQRATHFFIGKNIVAHIPEFNTAFKTLQDDIAVHTWSHPQMTTLDNDHVVAELGYTLQAIRDLTGGRLAKYWRPPTGDIDARVSAIAREVFGMDAIIWNNDPRDWALSDTPPPTTPDQVSSEIAGWLKGPKSPGVIILEHELTDTTVNIFMQNYPIGKAAGWKIMPVSNSSAWRNAADDTSAPTSMPLVLAGSGGSGSATGGAGSASSTGTGAAGTTGTGASGSKTTGTSSGSTTGTGKPADSTTKSGAAQVVKSWSLMGAAMAVMSMFVLA